MTVKSSTNRSDGHDSLENEIIPASFNINLATPDPPLIPDSDSVHCWCALTSGKAEIVKEHIKFFVILGVGMRRFGKSNFEALWKWNRDVFIFLLQTYFQ